MRIGIAGDIHGHREEFEEMLLKLEAHGVDAILQLGDLVDRGVDSAGCVRVAREFQFTGRDGQKHGITTIMGNHENNILHGRRGWKLDERGFVPIPKDREVFDSLSESDIDWLETLPYFHRIRAEGYDFSFVHGGVPYWTKTPGWAGRGLGYTFSRLGYYGDYGQVLDPFKSSNRHWADEYDGKFGFMFFGHTSFDKIRWFEHACAVDCSKHGRVAAVIVSTENEKPVEVYVDYKDGKWLTKKNPVTTGRQTGLWNEWTDERIDAWQKS
jgi:predicted phosphodiesterase